jgi:hypothetical protein
LQECKTAIPTRVVRRMPEALRQFATAKWFSTLRE